jgi:hypothetical protein
MIMASNKAWVVPAGNHDRRYCVLDVSPQVMQNEGYFDALNKELEDGGRAAMLHDLLAMDLSGFRVRAFPKTAAGLDQKLANAESHMDWLITCCMNGQIDPFEEDWAGGYGLPKRVVYALYCGTNGKNKLSAGQFAAQLHKLLGPYGFRSTKIREPRTRESDDKEVMVRVPYFVFPSLEDCRRAIDQALGQEIPWPADEGDWDGAAHSGDGDWDPELDKV